MAAFPIPATFLAIVPIPETSLISGFTRDTLDCHIVNL